MRRTLITVLAVLALGAACGSDTTATTTTRMDPTTAASVASTTTRGSATFPVTVTGANGEVTIASKPTRIVSLSPTATEMLFAIGAGAQVVAVDSNSNYPADAPKTALSYFQPNVEAVVGYQPDLVVMSNDSGNTVASLQAARVPVLLLPAAKVLDDAYSQIEVLGTATGQVTEAGAVVAGMRKDIDDIVKALPAKSRRLTYYHELDNTFYSVTSATFLGAVYSLLNLENIADAADKDQSGYPQLSPEYILERDPDLILLADTKCCQESRATVAARPGFDQLRAVRDGNVIELDDDIASRWGPRVVNLLRTVAVATERVQVG